jgi:hypothetical protein
MHHADEDAVKQQICNLWSLANGPEVVDNDLSRAAVLANITRACSFRLYVTREGAQINIGGFQTD